MELNQEDLQRSLISFAIEKTLLKIGKPEYELVSSRLLEYDCHLPDCYYNPEYLKLVLKDIYGNAYLAILDQIEEELGELAKKASYNEFLAELRK